MSAQVSAHNSPLSLPFGQIDHSQSTTQRETLSQKDQQYNDYVIQRKKLQSSKDGRKQESNQKFFFVVISIIFFVMLLSAVVYKLKINATSISYDGNSRQNDEPSLLPPNHFYTRHSHAAATAGPSAPASEKCNSLLPYNISSSTQTDIQKSYYQWYGKVGSYIYGRSYDVGHFIERHVAVNGKCTDYQVTQGKSVFYDWNQVTKAYKQTIANICPLGDRTTFSYDFEVKIPSPTDYIKGIDCRSGTVRKYSRVLALYRRAIDKRNPTSNEYLDSNHVTLWTFYPKI